MLLFPSHPHGCDPYDIETDTAIPSFNPRTRTGATDSPLATGNQSVFQSTHPHGCDLNLCILMYIQFQSTHPHGCDCSNFIISTNILMFQSTHPHGVRQNPDYPNGSTLVSIHAPARGATHCLHALSSILCVFNPRTRTGATALQQFFTGVSIHAPHGVRPTHSPNAYNVSIHAPARSATNTPGVCLWFQSRTRTGATYHN